MERETEMDDETWTWSGLGEGWHRKRVGKKGQAVPAPADSRHVDKTSRLVEDICVRHAVKHIDKYVADFERALGRRMERVGSSFEFRWWEDYEWIVVADGRRNEILDCVEQQKMFTVKQHRVEDRRRSCRCREFRYRLFFIFEFHPENAELEASGGRVAWTSC